MSDDFRACLAATSNRGTIISINTHFPGSYNHLLEPSGLGGSRNGHTGTPRRNPGDILGLDSIERPETLILAGQRFTDEFVCPDGFFIRKSAVDYIGICANGSFAPDQSLKIEG